MSDLLPLLRNTSFAEWNFTANCSASASYVQQLWENPQGEGLTSLVRFLRSSLPPGLAANLSNSTLDDRPALLSWFVEIEPLPRDIIDNVSQVCKTQLCPLLYWEGEPDAAGVGVSTALCCVVLISPGCVVLTDV